MIYLADCPAGTDEVWHIQWPFTPAGSTVTVSCGVDFVGNVIFQVSLCTITH